MTSFLYTDCILDHILHGPVPINVLKHTVLAAEEVKGVHWQKNEFEECVLSFRVNPRTAKDAHRDT